MKQMIAKNTFIEIVCYLFIFLFLYTGVMKLIDHLDFYFAIEKSYILYRFASVIAWVIPILELSIVVCLLIQKLKRIGLYASFMLMALFTIYVGYNAFFTTHEERPCTCGGIIENMTWVQHFFFNTAFSLLALLAIRFYKQKVRGQAEFTETRNLSYS
jgi:uncharacterized membrane protein YphA (DoxX/SURF4 family)